MSRKSLSVEPVPQQPATDEDFENSLASLDKEQSAASHQRCNVWREPGRVLVFSVYYLCRQALEFSHYVATHPAFFMAVVPLVIFYSYLLWVLEGPHVEYLHHVNAVFQDALFWFFLGVASSIGFGSGMHSGVVFLFPHIYKVCMAADVCNTLSFQTNVFMRDGPAEGLSLLPIGNVGEMPGYCECEADELAASVAFWPRVFGVMSACVLWGAGTALGEVPPYFLARKAARGGHKTELLEEEAHSSMQTLEAMKKWMIDVVERYGFVAVFLFASWPNAFFDLCGLCCGAIQMPFFTFFSAVFLGKAIVKVGLQAMFFVMVFTESYFKLAISMITYLLHVTCPAEWGDWASDELNRLGALQLDKFKHGTKHKGEGGSAIVSTVVFLFVAHFMAKALEQFAFDYERVRDEEHIASLKEQVNSGKAVAMTPRESSSRPYSLLIVVPAIGGFSAWYFGSTFGLTFVLPLATLAIAGVFLDLGQVHAPVSSLGDLSIVSYLLFGLASVLLPLILIKVESE